VYSSETKEFTAIISHVQSTNPGKPVGYCVHLMAHIQLRHNKRGKLCCVWQGWKCCTGLFPESTWYYERCHALDLQAQAPSSLM